MRVQNKNFQLLIIITTIFFFCKEKKEIHPEELKIDILLEVEDKYEEKEQIEEELISIDGDFFEEKEVAEECQIELQKGLCFEKKDCKGDAECIGSIPCPTEEPCFGICNVLPGVCMYEVNAKGCFNNNECLKGFICVGEKIEEEKPGLCRKKPPSGYCWEDKDCEEGEICVGEYFCNEENYCYGMEFFGRCKGMAPKGKCYDNTQCKNGKVCTGMKLCLAGEDCKKEDENLGECKSPLLCRNDEDCPPGKFCTGWTKCPEGKECKWDEVMGFCTPPPGYTGCFEDTDCEGEKICHSAITCPVGYLCPESIPGICASAQNKGIIVTTDAEKYPKGARIMIALSNKSGHIIFVLGCNVFALEQWNENKNKFELVQLPLKECEKPQWIRAIANGSGYVETVKIEKEGKFRFNLFYAVKCIQGTKETETDCAKAFIEGVKSNEIIVE